MPLQQCQRDGLSGWRWGKRGRCYTGGNARARARALKQARAIRASGYTGNVRRRKRIRTQIVPSNPLKADPTRTTTLRRIFQTEISKRFARLRRKIMQLVVEEDAFGLKRKPSSVFTTFTSGSPGNEGLASHSQAGVNPASLAFNEERDDERTRAAGIFDEIRSKARARYADTDQDRGETNAVGGGPEFIGGGLGGAPEGRDGGQATLNQRWAFQTDPQKVMAFRQWLETQVQIDVMGGAASELDQAYWKEYVEQGYQKGAGRAFDDTRKAALQDQGAVSDFYQGTKDEFLRSAFAQPVAIEKVQLLAGRVYTGLKGVTEEMSTKMTRILADGLTMGQNPTKIARTMIKEGMGFTKKRGVQSRALTIARTEIIRAHAEGQLDAFENLGVTKLGVMAEWSTAGDDRVCPLCESLDGIVITVKEARGILPRHPNCRCAYIPANVGESTKGQKRSKAEIRKAMDDSIRAELPKGRTIKGLKGRRFQDSKTGRFTSKTKRTLAQQKRRTSWAGADKTIAKTRPKGILEPTKVTPKVSPKPPAPKPKPKPGKVAPKRKMVKKKPPRKKVVESPKQRLEKSVEKKERELQKLTKEKVVVFDEKGNVTSSIEGSETSVNTFLRKSEINGRTVLHNHPLTDKVTPPTFSKSDIQTAIKSEIGEMRVVASTGDRFSMKFGNTLKKMSKSQKASFAKQVGEDWDIAMRQKIGRIEKDLVSGKLLRKDALKKIVGTSDEAWKSVAKINGLDYKKLKSLRGSAKATKAATKQASSMLGKTIAKKRPRVRLPKPQSSALTGSEQGAVNYYTSLPGGESTTHLQSLLRSTVIPKTQTEKEFVAHFRKAAAKMPVKKTTAYRGLAVENLEDFEVGKILRGRPVESWTTSQDVGKGYAITVRGASQIKGGNNTRMVVLRRRGTFVDPNAVVLNPSGKEVWRLDSTGYVVKKARREVTVAGDFLIVDVEQATVGQALEAEIASVAKRLDAAKKFGFAKSQAELEKELLSLKSQRGLAKKRPRGVLEPPTPVKPKRAAPKPKAKLVKPKRIIPTPIKPVRIIPKTKSEKVIAKSTGGTEESRKRLQAVAETMLGESEKRLQSGLKKVTFHKDSKALTKFIGREGGQMPPGHAIHGWYDEAWGEVHVLSEGSTGEYAHELAHVIDSRLRTFTYDPKWREIWKSEIHGGRLTDYATTDASEGFAEYARLVFSNLREDQKRAMKSFPKAWAYWKDKGLR